MSGESVKRIDAAGLRASGRTPETPFCLALADGSDVLLQRLLRVLPGKRIVGEGQWNGRHVLAKLFVAGGSARHWAQEKAGIEALRNAGVPTPDLLLAVPLASGGHVLLTAFLDAAQTLDEAWEPLSALPAGSPAALDVLFPAFRMLGTLHACGLVQEDLHLGNFLRCAERLYVIDGDAVRSISPGKALGEPRASANLAVLLAQLPMAWDAWRSELLEAYRAGGGCGIGDVARLDCELSRVRNWRLKDFLGKTLRDCTLFEVRRSAFRFTAVRRAAAERLAPLLEAPDAAMLRGRLLKDGKTCTVARVEQAGYALVVKRYNLKSLRHALERFWRPTRAWHSWREGHRLQHLGISTPTPLALIEERFGPLRRRAFLINEFCPGVSLLHFLSPDREPEVDVAHALASLFHRLHALRISHGDLKASNLLWHDGRVSMIDLDALVQHRSATGYARAWRRDRERLLRNWPASSILHRWLDRNIPPASAG
mgnify:FL=1